MHVTWGPDADKLSAEERDEIVRTLRAKADEDHELHQQRAVAALEGLPFVAVPIDQMADLYKRLKILTRLGQATIEAWTAMPKAEKELRHAIFAEADFGALIAGQWLPRDVRDKVYSETRKE